MAEALVGTLRRLTLWARASEGRKGRGLVMLALVVYMPALSGGFVWDDWILLAEPQIRRLDGIASIWLSPSALKYEAHYWPVVYTSFWIEHKLWGFHPAGYHAVNVVLHALNSVLVWRLLLRLAVPGAWLVAAAFAVHPVHVESVAWIIERKDLLSTLFYLAAVHVWLRFTETPDGGRYLACLALFAAALLSKSIAVTLPAALLLLQWWRERRVTWLDAARVAPFFVLAAGVTVGDLALYRDKVDYAFDYSLAERTLIAARALWTYLHQLVWPAHLPVLYFRWKVHPADVSGWLALAGLVALGVGMWLARNRIGRGLIAGALFFVLTLSPVLGFVDFTFMRIAFMADRFQYLASIGPLAVLLSLSVVMIDRTGQRRPRVKAGAVFLAAVTLAGLGVLTWRQSEIYRDGLTFAHHIAAFNPEHHFGQILLSGELNAAGHHVEALAAAKRAVARSEGLRGFTPSEAHLPLAAALLDLDHPAEAEAVMRRSLALWPHTRKADRRLHLARSLVRQARWKEGLAIYREILVDEPDAGSAHMERGIALLESGRYVAAVESFRRALSLVRLVDDEPRLYGLMGKALHKLGQLDVAAAHLNQALKLNPNHIRTLLARADLEADRQSTGSDSVAAVAASEPSVTRSPASQGEEDATGAGAWLVQARERCREVITKKPEHALARVLLGAVLLRMQEYKPAAEALQVALALTPARPVAREAHKVLGEVRERQGRNEDAARHYQNALDIYSLDAEALERLADVRFRERAYQAALPLYRQLVKATPFVAEAHRQLGMTLYRLGRHSDALPVLERAMELASGLNEASGLRERRLREDPRKARGSTTSQ